MASENIVIITNENFESEVVNSDKPVMVDFWANWCGPCKGLAPIIDEIANEYSDKVKVGKVDVDANGELSMKFRVMSIPTVIFFKNGEQIAREVGAFPKEKYAEIINSL
ncbi:thioredoxin [Anaerofustis stercorihominis]|uniref:Thioredoxin n=1 Tax=Anaerofustis stercorihominis DSM 17244 TaxID=445971 RepID=B1CBF6_9FIRM|nr:thioredoxin [Anaerofustis stercorihominis]EDS71603.1 thioredoxin [Anaerofustis stercorihominis DSM 17244]MCQ4796338.1 thioredoxin [Anaerofustis stercorihominis]